MHEFISSLSNNLLASIVQWSRSKLILAISATGGMLNEVFHHLHFPTPKKRESRTDTFQLPVLSSV